jgi:uncharacterized protein YceK
MFINKLLHAGRGCGVRDNLYHVTLIPKSWICMRYIIILVSTAFIFTGCFTISTLDRAKLDRKPERVKTVLTSYKDTSGHTVVVYRKKNKKTLYKAVVPLDSIINDPTIKNKWFFQNADTADNFKEIFSKKSNDRKGYIHFVVFKQETQLADTAGLYKEIEKDKGLVAIYTRGMRSQDGYTKGYDKASTVSFVVKDKKDNDSTKAGVETYVIRFEPNRRKAVRYLLVPLTVGLDAVTWPFQVVVFIMLSKKVPLM